MKLQLTYKINGILYDYAIFESVKILKDWIKAILIRGATEVKIVELPVSKTNSIKGKAMKKKCQIHGDNCPGDDGGFFIDGNHPDDMYCTGPEPEEDSSFERDMSNKYHVIDKEQDKL